MLLTRKNHIPLQIDRVNGVNTLELARREQEVRNNKGNLLTFYNYGGLHLNKYFIKNCKICIG